MKRIIIGLFAFLFMICFMSIKKVYASEITDYVSKYEDSGLVSFYSGLYNTRSGHSNDATSWDNLAGTNSLSLTTNSKNKFNEEGFLLDTTKQNFSSLELNTVNGNEFTLEFIISNFNSKGKDFNTFINSANDNFAFFRRVSTDIFEFKFAGFSASSRPTIKDAFETLNEETLISITYKVNGNVNVYINGILKGTKTTNKAMGADTLFFGHDDASRNYSCLFKTFRFYNRSLTDKEIESNAKADSLYGDSETVKHVNHASYNNSNIIGGLSGIRYVNSSEELNNIMVESFAPTVCVFKLDSTLNAIVDSGASIPIKTAIETLNERIIPGFEVSDSETKNSLVSYLKQNKYYDCFVISSSEDIIASFKKSLPALSYVLDLSSKYNKIEDIDFATIRSKVHSSGSNVAILPIEVCSHSNVQKLYNMGVNVWTKLNDESDKEIFQGIVSGAIGVITDKTGILTSIVRSEFNENSLTRMPLNIAHRGMPKDCPENTIDGAMLAVYRGANVIELDIQLTTDNKLAVMHDSTTDRTCNKNLTVEISTMAELKELYVNKGFTNTDYTECKIPELKEYFEEFGDQDVMFFIEIKSYKENIVSVLKSVIEEYNMMDRITIISFTSSQISKVLELMPEANIGLLLNEQTPSEDLEADLDEATKTIGKYNSTLNPNRANFTKETVAVCNSRGISIYPWTYNTEEEYTEAILAGYAGLTGNRANILGNLVKSINVNYESKQEYHVGDTISFSLETRTYDDTVSTHSDNNVTIKLVDLNRTDKIEGTSLTFTRKGTVDLVISYTYDFNGSLITYYSDVISFEVLPKEENKKPEPVVEEKQEDKGCASTLSTGVASIILLGFASLLILKKKNDQ